MEAVKSSTNYYNMDVEGLKKKCAAKGIEFQPLSQIMVELMFFKEDDPETLGGLSKMQHGKNIVQLLWPWWFKYWHDWSELMLWAWCNYKEIAMTGCMTAHKTFTFTGLALMEWLANPQATSYVMTSVTSGALRKSAWNETKNFYDTSRARWGYHIRDHDLQIMAKRGDDKHSVRGIAMDQGDPMQAIGKAIGHHPSRMIILVDEAAQTPEAIFTARNNMMAETKFARFVAIANAVDQYDSHGKFCEPKAGWSTISVNDEQWETKTGICLHFDGLKSPNVRQGGIYPKLFSQSSIDTTKQNHGENSLQWWKDVRGYWPPSGVRNTVLDGAIINDGKASEAATWEGSGKRPLAALDPAFTTGGDRCILRFGLTGNFVDGVPGLLLGDIVNIKLVEDKNYPKNYQIADRVISECMDRQVRPEDFTMDATSASGLADILSQRWSVSIRKVQFGGSATDEPVSDDDDREAKKVYANRVTQLWFNVNKVVTAGRMRGLDPATAKEFCTRQYMLKNERTMVEPKKDMKERTGGESPDLADAACLLVHRFKEIHGIKTGGQGHEQNLAEWNSLVNKYRLTPSYR